MTLSSSSTSVLARPMACCSPPTTHTDGFVRSIRWAVYPLDTIASVATRAATTVPLVTVATSERWVANQDGTGQPSATSTHFSALAAPDVPLRLTVTVDADGVAGIGVDDEARHLLQGRRLDDAVVADRDLVAITLDEARIRPAEGDPSSGGQLGLDIGDHRHVGSDGADQHDQRGGAQ